MAKRDFRETQYAFAAHLREPALYPAPDDVEDRRIAIYRDLFFNNISSLLAGTFPVLNRILGARSWKELVRAFYHRHVSHTPLFMEVPQEFLAWLADGFEEGSNWPPFLQELAHYEWVELAVSVDQNEIDNENFDANGNLLDGVPVLSPVAWPLAYRFPVHRIGPDYQPLDAPGQPTFLVVCRQRNDEVAFTEINAVTARLLELIQQDEKKTGRALLAQIAEELGHNDARTVIEGGDQILQDLVKQQIILGTRC